MVKCLSCLVMLGVSASAIAAPPPPPPPDIIKTLPTDVRGYNIARFYGPFVNWVESHKGEAVDNILQKLPELENEKPFGAPLLAYRKYNGYGHFLSGEMRAFCNLGTPEKPPSEKCHYIVRRAYVPDSAAGYKSNPVADWTRSNFDIEKIAAKLEEMGVATDANSWMVDKDRLFGELPSPVPMLQDNVRTHELDSKRCPELVEALENMERQRFDLPIDFSGVGSDKKMSPPVPHAIRTTDTITIMGEGGPITINGSNNSLWRFAKPIMTVVEKCEKKLSGNHK